MLAMPKRTPAKRIKLLSSKEVYSGPVFSVFTDFVQEGEYRGRRDVIRHPGSIVVFAIDDEKSADPNILLEYQYRHVVGDHIWELPAGRIDPGETKLAAAKRELLEETGYRAKRWKRAFQFYASPGFLDETMDIFIASGLTQGNARPEEDEQITTRFFPLSSAVKLVMNATIFDAKTMTAVLWYANQQSRKS